MHKQRAVDNRWDVDHLVYVKRLRRRLKGTSPEPRPTYEYHCIASRLPTNVDVQLHHVGQGAEPRVEARDRLVYSRRQPTPRTPASTSGSARASSSTHKTDVPGTDGCSLSISTLVSPRRGPLATREEEGPPSPSAAAPAPVAAQQRHALLGTDKPVYSLLFDCSPRGR